MKNNLLIIGASGHGKVVADVALKMNIWNKIEFLDDDTSKKCSMGLPIVGGLLDVNRYVEDYDLFVGIGNNEIREKIQNNLECLGASIPVIIHPSTIIGDSVKIFPGSVVMAGAIINCCSLIGSGCIINTGVIIEHDNNIEDYVHISPGARLAGGVHVERSVWIGIGATIINSISIKSNSIIGAGAVVVKNIYQQGKYIGVPAKKID